MRGPFRGADLHRLRPYLILILMGVVPILALAAFAYGVSSRAVERLVHSRNDATAVMMAAFVEREFEQWEFTLSSYAAFPVLAEAVATGNLAEIERRLELIVEQHPRMDRAFVTDLTGLLWADFPIAPESRGRRFDDRDWFRGVSGTMGTYISEIYQRHADPPVFVVSVAVPVRSPQTGEAVGFLVGQMLPGGIADLLRQVGAGAAGTVILLDHTGAVVAHPTLDLSTRRHLEYAEFLPEPAAADGQPARGEYRDPLRGEAMIASFQTVGVGARPWTVIAKQPVVTAFGPVRALALQLAAAGFLLTLLIGGLTVGLARENARRGEAERALEAMNRDLEGLVEERTTELRQAEAELLQAQKLEAVGRLAGGIAHDFNNLLTVILGATRLVLEESAVGTQRRSDLEDVLEASEQAADLTHQLLAFSRKQVMVPEILDVNEAVKRVRGILERLIGENIDMVFRLTPDLHPVKFDPGQIQQVLMNLAVNAKDSMPRGGKLTIKTDNVELDEAYAREHPGTRPGPHVMLAVADTGEGMEEETRERIFEPFFTTKAQGHGTGLGLSTVYGIVKQGGGSIWVYSEPGRGTTFKVYLPRTDEVPREPVQKAVDVTRPDAGTVLVVEDSDPVRGLVVRILREAGFTVAEAPDAKSAAELSRSLPGPVDLLLTDVVLPDRSGPELADELGKRQAGLKVLFMSGYTDDSIVHHGILSEEIAFIEKPLRPEELLRKVREVMAGEA